MRMRSITRYLHTQLKLMVNPAKSKVAPLSECSFLGFTIKGKKIRWTAKALANFTKIKHLLALGVSLKTAIQHGVSSKSYWHMARTPAVQQALSNAWLKAQGLVSVKDLWCKAQGYTT